MNNLFRVSVTLTEPVDRETLQQALHALIRRVPYYQVCLKRGVFWHYLERTDALPVIGTDSAVPCRWLPKDIEGNGNLLFYVRVHNRRIALEISHILADGTGALTFLKSLLAEYLIRKGWAMDEEELAAAGAEDGRPFLRPRAAETGRQADEKAKSAPDPQEYEDAYRRVYSQGVPFQDRMGRAYKYRSSSIPLDRSPVLIASMPADSVLGKSRELGISLTEYICSIIIAVLQEDLFSQPEKLWKRQAAPIRIAVPVNLRKLYPSKTMRNFSLILLPGIDPRVGKFSFDEIVKVVHHSMRGSLIDRTIAKQMSRNVQGELRPFTRAAPLPMKKLLGEYLHKKFGESQYSINCSNLGNVYLPKAMQKAVERFDFILGPRVYPGTNISMISCGGTLSISFRRNQKDPSAARDVCRFLVRQGIPVTVDSSMPWEDL